MNADDTRDFRPGQRAAEEHEVLAPLADAGLTKLEIRTLAKAAGYTLWDRPAAPCLSFARRIRSHGDPRSAGAGGARRGESAPTGLSRVSRPPSRRTGARGNCASRDAPRALDGDAGRDHGGIAQSRLPVRHARYGRFSLRVVERSVGNVILPAEILFATRRLAKQIEFTIDANWISGVLLRASAATCCSARWSMPACPLRPA